MGVCPEIEIKPFQPHIVILQTDVVCIDFRTGARCSSVVRAFAHGAISRSRQCTTTGVTKAVVCVCRILHIKEPLRLIGKSSPCGGSRFPLSLSE